MDDTDWYQETAKRLECCDKLFKPAEVRAIVDFMTTEGDHSTH